MQREASLVVRVDQLVRSRRNARQDAEPGVRILPFVGARAHSYERRSPDAVRAVTRGDELALHALFLAIVAIGDPRPAILSEITDVRRFGLEQQLASGRKARLDQVLDDLLLAVDRDAAAG